VVDQAAISLYEGKLNEAESQRYELEDKIRVLEEKIRKAEEKDKATAAEAGISSPTIHQGQTAAEIDNETLHEQIKHLQHKLSSLEELLDEARSQLESDNDAWKARLAKSKEAEGASKEQIKSLKAEVAQLNKDASGAKGRINELEGALKENRAALEGARAEIESLRSEVAVSDLVSCDHGFELMHRYRKLRVCARLWRRRARRSRP
jgi:CAP-Gly domain-containing linker protein 1